MSKKNKGIDWKKWYATIGETESIDHKEEQKRIIIFISVVIVLGLTAIYFDWWRFFVLIFILWIVSIIFKAVFSLCSAAFQQFIGTWKK